MISPLIEKLRSSAEFVALANRLVQEIPKFETIKCKDMVGRSGSKLRTHLFAYDPTMPDQIRYLFECDLLNEDLATRLEAFTKMIADLQVEHGVMFSDRPPSKDMRDYAKSRRVEIISLERLGAEEMSRLPNEYIIEIISFAGMLKGFKMFHDPPNPLSNPAVPLRFPEFVIARGRTSDPLLNLFSVKTGKQGDHLTRLLLEKRRNIIRAYAQAPFLALNKEEDNLAIRTEILIDFSDYEFRQLRSKFGLFNLSVVQLWMETHVDRSRIISRTKLFVHLAAAVTYYLDRLIGRTILWGKYDFLEDGGGQDLEKIIDNKLISGELLEDNFTLYKLLEFWRDIKMPKKFRKLATKVVALHADWTPTEELEVT